MMMSDIQKMNESIDYNEVGEKIRHLIEGDTYEDFIMRLVKEEGGTPAEKIAELLDEVLDHRMANADPEEADAWV